MLITLSSMSWNGLDPIGWCWATGRVIDWEIGRTTDLNAPDVLLPDERKTPNAAVRQLVCTD